MRPHKRTGSMSVYILLSMGVLVTASLGVSSYAVQSLRMVRIERDSVTAQQAAIAALDHMITKAYVQVQQDEGDFEQATVNLDSDINSLAPNCTAVGTVKPLADPSHAYITATVTYRGVTKSVRSLIGNKDVGIWNNAIFAGAGASGQAINGNVDIRGSVHILGDGEAYTDLNGNGQRDAAEPFTDKNGNGIRDGNEAFTDSNGDGVWNPAEPYNDSNMNGLYDPPLTQTDLNSSFSGTAYIGNHYSGMPVALEAQVPASPKVGGIETLSAEVRVKHGQIKIQGSATIGSPAGTIDGGTSKATLDGTYVNDGYTGSAGASAVHSDNGTTNTYDLGNLGIKFPLISGIGSEQYAASDGTQFADHETFLNNRSLACPVTTITASTPAFSYGPDARGNFIAFQPAASGQPAKMIVNGIVKFNGNLQLGSKDTLTYMGNGTLYTTGNMNIDGNLLPAAGFKFPTTARMGFIAKGNLNLATGSGSSQLSMAGAFYAQSTIKSAKQNQIAGTFVANYYDLGTNVPNIYQVPDLTSNMPPGMPGDKHYFTLRLRSWRDRSPAPGQSVSY